MMSVSAVIASIDGKLAGPTGSFFAASGPACGAAESMSVVADSDLGAVFACCFRRAQRRKTLLVSVTACSLYSARKRFAIALALDEGTIDMMSDHKLPDDLGELVRHGHLIDQIVARVGKSFALRWINGDGRQFV